jgi:hypothetical protein
MPPTAQIDPPEVIQAREQFSYPGQLKRALEEAMLILAYTSERGIAVDNGVAQTLVRAKYLDKEDKWTATDESDFWVAYNQISQVIRPVTIESIRAAFDTLQEPNWFYRLLGLKNRRVTSQAQKAVRRYTWMGLTWLVLMLTVQIYSLIGSTLMNNLATTDQKMQAVEKEIADLTTLGQGNPNAILQATQKQTTLDALGANLQNSAELLASWQKPINSLILKDKYYSLDTLRSREKVAENGVINQDRVDIINRIKQVGQYPILIMSLYVLPLLYGLLGAYAFVLRTLNEDIKTMVYSSDSDIKYVLRIHLGALAGLAVGLFFVPEDTTTAVLPISLSPLALAFLAGYSVEFFFSAMDRFITGLAQRNSGGAEQGK